MIHKIKTRKHLLQKCLNSCLRKTSNISIKIYLKMSNKKSLVWSTVLSELEMTKYAEPNSGQAQTIIK